MNKEELFVVTEVGCFEELDLNDPTIKKTKKKSNGEQSIEELIEESINTNRDNFIKG